MDLGFDDTVAARLLQARAVLFERTPERGDWLVVGVFACGPSP